LARTYGWEKQYDTATLYIQQVIHRAPAYADAYVALADVEYWQGASAKSLQASNDGLQVSGSNPDLMLRKARSLSALGKDHEAKLIVDVVIKNGSRDEMALELERRLKNK
jgi:predicted Zn-dependent protease